jgi:DNA-binding transcriptional MerR regulator
MPQLTISEVAQQAALQASAIRYYEQIGLLSPAQRMSGQGGYDTTALYRLAIFQQATQLGFTLDEIRRLFFDLRDVTRASERWQTLFIQPWQPYLGGASCGPPLRSEMTRPYSEARPRRSNVLYAATEILLMASSPSRSFRR